MANVAFIWPKLCAFARCAKWMWVGCIFVGTSLEAQSVSDVSVHLSSKTVSDGFSVVNAKTLPTATVEYQVRVEYSGLLMLAADSLVITNPIPSALRFYVGDVATAGTGPIEFSEGSRASQLQCAFGGFADGNDCIEFSADGGVSFGYQPQPDSEGCDPAITHIRVRPKGSMAPAALVPSSFILRYRMKVK